MKDCERFTAPQGFTASVYVTVLAFRSTTLLLSFTLTALVCVGVPQAAVDYLPTNRQTKLAACCAVMKVLKAGFNSHNVSSVYLVTEQKNYPVCKYFISFPVCAP